jgi:hypothetical protein
MVKNTQWRNYLNNLKNNNISNMNATPDNISPIELYRLARNLNIPENLIKNSDRLIPTNKVEHTNEVDPYELAKIEYPYNYDLDTETIDKRREAFINGYNTAAKKLYTEQEVIDIVDACDGNSRRFKYFSKKS